MLAADAEFLSALPPTTLGSPLSLRIATVGSDPVLPQLVAAAAEFDARIAQPLGAADALRPATPETRSAEVRSWDAVAATWREGEAIAVGWLTATVLAPDDGAIEGSFEAATDAGGPYAATGSSTSSGDDAGTLLWDRAIWSPTASPAEITLSWGPDGTFADTAGSGVVPTHEAVVGEVYTFDTRLLLTEDGVAWPAVGTVSTGLDGGIAEGVLSTDKGDVPFTVCWSGAGDTLAVSGGEGVPAEGDGGLCP